MIRSVVAVVALAVVGASSLGVAIAADKVSFARDIRPILSNQCFQCHGPDAGERKAGLRLDIRDVAVKELESGERAVVPGQSAASELVRRIRSTDATEVMPPPSSRRKLSDAEKTLIARWIEQGAQYEAHWSFIAPPRPELPQIKIDRTLRVRNDGTRSVPPTLDWPRNPIDHFVLARLVAEQLTPSPAASKETLIRRVSLDLTGLPPTPADVDAFLADSSPDAYEKVVDRLLASPRFGERMAQVWLDVARYADTNGYNNDEERVMWRWRDWVIEAFNRNLPFDGFVIEQLAGDLLPDATLAQRLATGFNRNHVLTTEGGIIDEEYRVEYVADRAQTTAAVFMGVTLQCARCHDHKFDPISQSEYFQLFAFFNSGPDRVLGYNAGAPATPYLKAPTDQQQTELTALDRQQRELDKRFTDRARQVDDAIAVWEKSLSAEGKAKLGPLGLAQVLDVPAAERTAEQRELVRRYYVDTVDEPSRTMRADLVEITKRRGDLDKAIPTALVMEDLAQPRKTHILKRGRYDQPAEEVSRGVPASLPPLPADAPRNRLALAKWLVDPSHPLTARVAVNRWWALLFGTGLVETEEDFGSQGAFPSHPELLDWLAREFVEPTGIEADAERGRRGDTEKTTSAQNSPRPRVSVSPRPRTVPWDTKSLLKLLVTSATYRQSSRVTPELRERDPNNRLLARGPRFRLPAETVRDNALAVSGLLVERLGGPSVKPYQPAGLWEDVTVERRFKYEPALGDGLYRRSLYTYWKRTCPPPGMTTFDAPDREFCVIRRTRTNTPLQALVLMNDPTYLEASRKLAERVVRSGDEFESRLTFAFRTVVARRPIADEVRVLRAVFDQDRTRFETDSSAASRLLSHGASLRDEQLNVTDLAAWTTVTSLLLSLDETITKG